MPVTAAQLHDAALRIEPFVVRTPVLRSDAFDDWVGTPTWCKSEHLQHAGAFKYRGATNAVRSLADDEAARGVAAHSSGNHAAALALAARTRNIPCHVVMPTNAPTSKRDRVRSYGATIVDCAPTESARVAALREVVAITGAIEIHPYDNDAVIAGAGTAALEFISEVKLLRVIVVPVGGGGLLAGTSIAAAAAGVRTMAGEPFGADDAYRSFHAGKLIPQTDPDTVADGLLTSLADRTFTIIKANVERIIRVDEAQILEAQATVHMMLDQRIEPSSAVAVAALRNARSEGIVAPETHCGVILSGGNVATS